MTKVQIKPEKFTPVGGLFYVANQFMHHIMPHVDNYLGRRSQLVGYQYGEILLTMASNFFSGTPVKFHQEDTLERILLNIIEQGVKIRSTRVDCGSYTEKVIKLLLEHSDKIFVRAAMNKTLRNMLANKHRQWRSTLVGEQQMEVLSIPFEGFSGKIEHCRLIVQRQRKRSGTQLDMFEDGGEDIYVYRAILTNEWDMDEEAAIDFYNQRGAKEKLFDQMDNDFGWHYLPKGLLKENTVFMILTAIIRNFYAMLLQMSQFRALKVYATTRMKTFINRIVSVVAKWTRSGRQDVITRKFPLSLCRLEYSHNQPEGHQGCLGHSSLQVDRG